MSKQSDSALRVLFVLGQSASREDALETAVDLAARLSAQLEALFVEDEDILRAAALPSVGQIVWGRSEPAPFGVGAVLRDWRALAERARTVLEREAQRLQVPTRFRVTRGARQSELHRAFAEGDLMMFAAARTPLSRNRPASSPRRAQPPLVRVLVDGSEASERALRVARALAAPSHSLEVWIPQLPEAESRALTASVRAQLGEHVAIREASFAEPSSDQLVRTLSSAAGGILVVPEAAALAQAITGPCRDVALPCWVVITR